MIFYIFFYNFQIIPLNNGGSGGKPLNIETNLGKPASLTHISPRTSSALSPSKLGSGSSSGTGGTRFSKTGKRIGRPPKKGTLLANSSLGGMAVTAASGSNPEVSIKRQVSPPSSPEPDDFEAKRRKTSPNKR